MWVTKLLISPVKKRVIRCPVGGSVGGCGARAVSRKTPIYSMLSLDIYYGSSKFLLKL